MMQDIYSLIGTTKEEVENIVNSIHTYYVSYNIIKNNGKGKRTIDAPQGRLKELQESLLKEVLYKFKCNDIAHGFIKNRSPKTNAEQHLGASCVIKIDLKDFFSSVKREHVHGTLGLCLNTRETKICERVSEEDLKLLSALLTRKGRVPQGAPTSPAITNLYALGLDKRLKSLCDRYKLTLTRYADDITISAKYDLNPTQKKNIITNVARFCSMYGLQVNAAKIKLRYKHSRMSVTGVVVNEKTNMAKPKYRILRAKVHNAYVGKTQLDAKALQELRGELEWLRSLNPEKAAPLIKKFGMIK